MKHLMGIDIGTTSLKGCVFDEKGEVLASVTKAYTLFTEGERVEFPAESYFKLFEEAYNELSAQVHIDAFAIDTQGETLIFLDKNGEPLMDAIVWLDNRAEKEARAIEAAFGLERIYETTGQTEVPAGYPAPKVLWLKNNYPELFAKLDKVLLLEDYLLYRITGKFVAERSLYSSTLYLNVKTGEYFKEMLDFIGIDEGYLPALYESGVAVGEYKGATVSTGALDQVSGFVGCGILREGIVSETTGTALAVCAFSKTVPPYFRGIKVPAHYVGKDKYCLLMWAPTAGMVMEWYKRTFCEDIDFKTLDGLASKVPLGSEGLTVSPNMRGSVMPQNDPALRGGVYGIDLRHTRAHFARAVMESIACLLRQYLECLGLPIDEVVSVGGGAKSKLWREIKADITGKRIVTLENKETGCLGTAIYAGVGAGIYESVEAASTDLLRVKDAICPTASREDANAVYDRYLALDDLLLHRGIL